MKPRVFLIASALGLLGAAVVCGALWMLAGPDAKRLIDSWIAFIFLATWLFVTILIAVGWKRDD